MAEERSKAEKRYGSKKEDKPAPREEKREPAREEGGGEDGHMEARRDMHKRHEKEARDMHGSHRDQLRDMHGRQMAEMQQMNQGQMGGGEGAPEEPPEPAAGAGS